MTSADLLYGTLPMVLTGVALVGLLFRLFTRPVALDADPPSAPAGPWGTVPVRWGLGIVLGLHVAVFVVPSWVTGWNSAPGRLYLLEGAGLAVSLWLLVGIFTHLIAFADDPDRPRVTIADVLVVLGVLTLVVTGILTALVDRWATYWGAEVAAPYARSLLTGSPRPELMGALPVPARVHTVAAFATLAAFPFSRWLDRLAVPARAVHRFVSDLVAPEDRDRPAGARVGWGSAWGRAALIVGYFVAFVVVVPSRVLDRMGAQPEFVRDAVGAGVWVAGLVGGFVLLRWAQRSARI